MIRRIAGALRAALSRRFLGVTAEEIRYTFEDVRRELRATRSDLLSEIGALRRDLDALVGRGVTERDGDEENPSAEA